MRLLISLIGIGALCAVVGCDSDDTTLTISTVVAEDMSVADAARFEGRLQSGSGASFRLAEPTPASQ